MVTDDLVLSATDGTTTARMELAIASGGRIRQISIERGGERMELLAPAPPEADPSSTGWGSFPMAPWAGRIRHGRFDVDGATIHLDLNHSDGDGANTGGGPIAPPQPASELDVDTDPRRHAIHGTTFSRAWTVEHATDDRCDIRCELAGALGWPFDGSAHQRLRLRPDGLDMELSVIAREPDRFPASIGWHPWFVKPARLDFQPTALYERDGIGIPTGRLIEPGPPPWDDCFLNTEPVTLHYARPFAPTITVRSDCDHLVIYDQPAHATCVEPQSGPPDAPNVRPEIVDSEQPLTRTMTISW